jgi:hypothetical protein
LLLVVAILLVLVTLYWGPKSGSRERALLKSCQYNLQKLHMALSVYANDHAGRYPVVRGAQSPQAGLEPLVPRYNSDTSIFICPGSKDSAPPAGQPLRGSKISYAYYMGRTATNPPQVLVTDQQVDGQAKGAGQMVFSSDGKPPGNNHGKSGGNLLLTDGQVLRSPAAAAMPLPVATGEALLNP